MTLWEEINAYKELLLQLRAMIQAGIDYDECHLIRKKATRLITKIYAAIENNNINVANVEPSLPWIVSRTNTLCHDAKYVEDINKILDAANTLIILSKQKIMG